jgi:hypothetical protein
MLFIFLTNLPICSQIFLLVFEVNFVKVNWALFAVVFDLIDISCSAKDALPLDQDSQTKYKNQNW